MTAKKLERQSFEKKLKLLNVPESYLLEIFPNPEGIGCPPDAEIPLTAIYPLQSNPEIAWLEPRSSL